MIAASMPSAFVAATVSSAGAGNPAEDRQCQGQLASSPQRHRGKLVAYPVCSWSASSGTQADALDTIHQRRPQDAP